MKRSHPPTGITVLSQPAFPPDTEVSSSGLHKVKQHHSWNSQSTAALKESTQCTAE
ncbi:UNVERIFIED_CONTAM: hypothetical protein FKN15_020966 [Acipenser sinensis]